MRQRAQVEQVLAVLPETEQQLLVGAAAGLSIEDLATKHGYTPGTVRTNISAAYRKIRNAFRDHDAFDL